MGVLETSFPGEEGAAPRTGSDPGPPSESVVESVVGQAKGVLLVSSWRTAGPTGVGKRSLGQACRMSGNGESIGPGLSQESVNRDLGLKD